MLIKFYEFGNYSPMFTQLFFLIFRCFVWVEIIAQRK